MSDLATPEQLAILRGVPFDAGDDLALLVLAGASAMVRSYCNQYFEHVANDDILLDGTGAASVLLPELPVNSVDYLALVSQDLTETEYVETDFTVDGRSGIIWRPTNWSWGTWDVWPKGHQNIRVVYDHGYEHIPADVVLVTLQLAARMHVLAGSAGRTVTAESIGTYSVTYADVTASTELFTVERGVLDRYRQHRVA